jgi:hypothetical protein
LRACCAESLLTISALAALCLWACGASRSEGVNASPRPSEDAAPCAQRRSPSGCAAAARQRPRAACIKAGMKRPPVRCGATHEHWPAAATHRGVCGDREQALSIRRSSSDRAVSSQADGVDGRAHHRPLAYQRMYRDKSGSCTRSPRCAST